MVSPQTTEEVSIVILVLQRGKSACGGGGDISKTAPVTIGRPRSRHQLSHIQSPPPHPHRNDEAKGVLLPYSDDGAAKFIPSRW